MPNRRHTFSSSPPSSPTCTSMKFFTILSVSIVIIVSVFVLATLALSPHLSPFPSSSATNHGSVVVGYYADWTSSRLPPEQIPFDHLTHLNYAFAVVGQDSIPTFSTASLLDHVINLAHSHNVKVLLSIGGWTGSRYLSPTAASNATRTTFVQAVAKLVHEHNLDGVDIDWEYPGRQGMSCNIVHPQDSANLVLLLGDLRQALGQKEITMAVRIQPFDGPSGPLNDLTQFLPVLDRVNIMAYDIHGAWDGIANPNAPLHGIMSVESAIQAWTNAHWPAERIALGLPFYGRAVALTTVNGAPKFGDPISKVAPKGDQLDAPWAEPCPGAPALLSGVWTWRNLRQQGLLPSPGKAGNGWTRVFDTISVTPYLYNTQLKRIISYDDPISIQAKVNMAKCHGLAGVMVWELSEDNGELMHATTTTLSSSIDQAKC